MSSAQVWHRCYPGAVQVLCRWCPGGVVQVLPARLWFRCFTGVVQVVSVTQVWHRCYLTRLWFMCFAGGIQVVSRWCGTGVTNTTLVQVILRCSTCVIEVVILVQGLKGCHPKCLRCKCSSDVVFPSGVLWCLLDVIFFIYHSFGDQLAPLLQVLFTLSPGSSSCPGIALGFFSRFFLFTY